MTLQALCHGDFCAGNLVRHPTEPRLARAGEHPERPMTFHRVFAILRGSVGSTGAARRGLALIV